MHQAGELPANAYVIDLDAVELNARAIAAEAAKYDLTVLAMTKQMGRNALLLPRGHARRSCEGGRSRHGMRARRPSRGHGGRAYRPSLTNPEA